MIALKIMAEIGIVCLICYGIYKENELVQFEDMLKELYIVLRQYARKKVKACRKTT